MTKEERIANHRKVIKQIHADIKWIEKTKFSITTGSNVQPGGNTKDLIQHLEQTIKKYEYFIARLEKRSE